MTFHDFGELPELHALRQKWAAKLAALNERHEAEEGELRDDYVSLLREQGIDDAQADREVMALIREAFPTPREYSAGVEGEADDDAS